MCIENNNREYLTPENVVVCLEGYISELKSSVKEVPYPINNKILIDFSFYMDYAIKFTDIQTIEKLHNLITYYFLDC